MDEIKIGDTVISFDFADYYTDIEGKNACYIEGVVEDIGRHLIPNQTCDLYKIKCTKKMMGGVEYEEREEYYYAPVNGTPKMMGKDCEGVIKVVSFNIPVVI